MTDFDFSERPTKRSDFGPTTTVTIRMGRTITHNGVPVAVVPTEPTKKLLVAMIAPGTSDEWHRGKEAQARLGLDVIPPNFECEKAAGQYILALAAAPSEPGDGLAELIGALWQVLDDMGPDGLSCSPAAKAQAIAALRPWIGSEGADVAPSGTEPPDA